MITVCGASGKTGEKISRMLINKNVAVRCIGRNESHLQELKKLGAELCLGDQENAEFLTKAFTGADAVYFLIPPVYNSSDYRAHYNEMGKVAFEAIEKSGVKKVVFLSSLGAELDHDNGPVKGLHDVEAILQKLTTVDIAFLRPSYFMENTLGTIPMIKAQKMNGGPVPPDVPFCMIATNDIAVKAAELLGELNFKGHTVHEIFGDYLSYRQATSIIGRVIGIPDLPYIQFSPEDAVNGLVQSMGLSRNLAESFVELGVGLGKGLLRPLNIDPQKPNAPTRFEAFARSVFLTVYNQST